MNDERITPKTWVPLGTTLAVMIMLLGFHTWLAGQLSTITLELRMIRQDLARTWTKTEMGAWAYQLRDRNTMLSVPDPTQIKTP
jgi:hypothetical protein